MLGEGSWVAFNNNPMLYTDPMGLEWSWEGAEEGWVWFQVVPEEPRFPAPGRPGNYIGEVVTASDSKYVLSDTKEQMEFESAVFLYEQVIADQNSTVEPYVALPDPGWGRKVFAQHEYHLRMSEEADTKEARAFHLLVAKRYARRVSEIRRRVAQQMAENAFENLRDPGFQLAFSFAAGNLSIPGFNPPKYSPRPQTKLAPEKSDLPKQGFKPPAGTRIQLPDIPKNWRIKPTKGQGGTRYVDPSNPGNSVRVMPGNPRSPYANSRRPYVRWQKNGQALDRNGRPVSKNSQEAHIPLDEFRFDPSIF